MINRLKYGIMMLAVLGLFPLGITAQASGGGSDSCGLGWEITKKKSMLATTTRATTNYFVPPTFGMTTGTIGCDKHSFAKNEREAVTYAYNNYDQLQMEMAEGQGEFLHAFAQSLGCEEAVYNDFAQMTQSHYSTLVTESASALDMYENVKGQIKQDDLLAANCGV